MDEKPRVNPVARAVKRVAQTHFALERVATALVARQPIHTALVVVVRPGLDPAVIAHPDHAQLRAALRVAAAAGNDRAWRGLTERIERRPVAELPAVVNLAAKEERMRTCYVGGVFVEGQLEAAMFWFSRRERESAADVAGRTDAHRLLAAATG